MIYDIQAATSGGVQSWQSEVSFSLSMPTWRRFQHHVERADCLAWPGWEALALASRGGRPKGQRGQRNRTPEPESEQELGDGTMDWLVDVGEQRLRWMPDARMCAVAIHIAALSLSLPTSPPRPETFIITYTRSTRWTAGMGNGKWEVESGAPEQRVGIGAVHA